MNGVNYLLMREGNSDSSGQEASVRGFHKLESAQAAMFADYRKMAAILNVPVGSNTSVGTHTIRAKNSIRIEWNGDWFKWEIIEAVPEDGISPMTGGKKEFGKKQFTVMIEEHIAQEFPIDAWDFFSAIDTAEWQYKRGSLTVQSSTPNARLIMARDDMTGETTEWKEF